MAQVRGVDLSAKMVRHYNEAVKARGLPAERMRAIQGDLLASSEDPDTTSELAGPEFSDFDLAVVSMALHHVTEPQELLLRLRDRLKDSGVLVIVDWTPVAHADHGDQAGPSTSHVIDSHSHHHHHHAGHAGSQHGTRHAHASNGHASQSEVEALLAQAGYHDVESVMQARTIKTSAHAGGEKRVFMTRGRK